MPKTRTAWLAAGLLAALAVIVAGCDTPRVLAPPPPLRAASAASYAVDVEFDVPLDKATAEDPSRYTLIPAGGGASAVITTATLIDTLNGRVVQLLIPDWLATNPDTTDFDLSTSGVVSVWGVSTGNRSVRFRTGLSYAEPMRAWFGAYCNACHGATRQSGSYRTDSYAGLFAGGTNSTPNVIAGDPKCLTVVKCKPHNSMFNAANLTYFDYELIKNWVESFSARP